MDVDAVADLAVADLLHEDGPWWLASLDDADLREVAEQLAIELAEQTEYPARWEDVAQAALDRARQGTGVSA